MPCCVIGVGAAVALPPPLRRRRRVFLGQFHNIPPADAGHAADRSPRAAPRRTEVTSDNADSGSDDGRADRGSSRTNQRKGRKERGGEAEEGKEQRESGDKSGTDSRFLPADGEGTAGALAAYCPVFPPLRWPMAPLPPARRQTVGPVASCGGAVNRGSFAPATDSHATHGGVCPLFRVLVQLPTPSAPPGCFSRAR